MKSLFRSIYMLLFAGLVLISCNSMKKSSSSPDDSASLTTVSEKTLNKSEAGNQDSEIPPEDEAVSQAQVVDDGGFQEKNVKSEIPDEDFETDDKFDPDFEKRAEAALNSESKEELQDKTNKKDASSDASSIVPVDTKEPESMPSVPLVVDESEKILTEPDKMAESDTISKVPDDMSEPDIIPEVPADMTEPDIIPEVPADMTESDIIPEVPADMTESDIIPEVPADMIEPDIISEVPADMSGDISPDMTEPDNILSELEKTTGSSDTIFPTIIPGNIAEKEPEKVVFEDPSHITVVLEGEGWIYLGEKRKTDDVELLSRTFGNNATIFSFKAGSGDFFVLVFQLQNIDGSSYVSEVSLEKKGSRALSGSELDPPSGADLSESTLSEEIQEGTAKALAGKENEKVSEIDDADGSEITDYDDLFDKALQMMKKSEYLKAAENLEMIREYSLNSFEVDRLYYLLGQCYEKTETERDPVKAEMYYSMLLDQFPFSIYYDRAEIRKRYLQKYFINIR